MGLEYKSREVKPLYAQGIFVVSKSGIVNQLIIYDYYDPLKYYYEILKDPKLYESELTSLGKNMQKFLNQEQIIVNNIEVKPKVMGVSLNFRGDFKHPYVLFIINFKMPLKFGENVYINRYEREIVEYNYEVLWIFEEGFKVTYVNVGFDFELINDRFLFFNVLKGQKTPGYEEIHFKLFHQ